MTNISWVRSAFFTTTTLCVALAACKQAPAAPIHVFSEQTFVQPTPPPVNTAALAGAYALTMAFSPACTSSPELSTPRLYDVRLEDAAPYPYLGIWISGGGYTAQVGVGSLWPGVDGQSAGLDWNNFDVGGCDGWPEPLPGGRALMVCGGGTASVDGRTIRADMHVDVFIEAAGERQKVCTGQQQFTFTRVTP